MSYAISIGFLVLTALHAPVAGIIPDLIRDQCGMGDV